VFAVGNDFLHNADPVRFGGGRGKRDEHKEPQRTVARR
jgi:hypothetical protein